MNKTRSNPNTWDLIVVGGGPAGFFAALACAAGAPVGLPFKILILEKANRPLGKVLVSGGGRCNLTHACFDPAQLVEYYPRGGAALRGAFTRFQPADTVAWFERRGVALKTEPDGRIFPASDDAQTVVECLLDATAQAGIRLQTRAAADAIFLPAVAPVKKPGESAPARFTVALNASTETFKTRCLLLATGGEAASGTAGTLELAESLGHTIQPPVPSLFTFRIPDPRLEGLAGISVNPAGLQLLAEDGTARRAPGMQQLGPLLITHWGLSGPAVLRLSAWAARELSACAYHAGLRVNWLGETNQEQALASLQAFKDAHASQKPGPHYPFELPQRLWDRLCQAVSLNSEQNWGDLPKATLQSLAEQLTGGRYSIRGRGPFKEEFVTCGGVSLDEMNFKTMESRLTPGLYFAGEALDVDGLTGGFNLQNAWTTGYLAGAAAAMALRE